MTHASRHGSSTATRLFQSGLVARGRSWMTLLPVIGIIMAAVAARAWLLFGTDYVPGVNGAYYLVQARSLMERGIMGIPDMPLTFHLHAALSWLLLKVGGMGQADAILWAVKLCDAVLPPLVAWPVCVLVRRWAQARGQGDGVPLAAAALACFAWPWLRMVGDLQKNSLALVWLALLAMALHRWLSAPTPMRGVIVLACLLLLGLTHCHTSGLRRRFFPGSVLRGAAVTSCPQRMSPSSQAQP